MVALLGLTEKSTLSSLGFGVPRAQASDATEQHSLLAYGKPILVDADGLNALARIDDWWTRLPENRLVLTPHVGEFSRLMDMEPREVLADPERAAVSAARKFRQVVLLKGAPTIVTDGTTVYRASDSPSSLATGGSGDVLAGTIGALLAQGLTLADAANLGVYVGTRAARRLESELGTLGVVASDLPRAIAVELAALERS
jgi:NAD(P)H-hydrate epimerase